MPEKRRFHRVRPTGLVSKTATIFVNLQSPQIGYDLVDIGAGGACLDVHGEAPIPRKFVLRHSGVNKNCRVVWQKGRRIGVSF
jgi:hypothetical protein